MFKTTLSISLAIVAGQAFAGSPASEGVEKEKSALERLWELPVLYKNKNNPVLQEFALQGRLQLQFASGTSAQGSYGSEDRPDPDLWGDAIEVRRLRLGFISKWFNQFRLEGQIDVQPNFDPEFYGQIFDLNLTWEPIEAFNLGVGKFKANFYGLEQGISSKEILTFERGLLSDLLYPGELTGVRINGKKDDWVYGAAIYAGDEEREFTRFADGTVVQAYVGYDFHRKLDIETALVRLAYQHGSSPSNAGGGGRVGNAFALSGVFEQKKLIVYSEIVAAEGQGGAGDLRGFHITPAYSFTKKLQAVARYQYAHGDDDGLRLQSRYERLAPEVTDDGFGKNYHAIYVGLNYYVYGHRLKFMAGTEYHSMDGGGDGGDFDGWTTMLGFRLYF